MKIQVDCYSGFRGEERPKRFWIRSKKIEIKQIIDQWVSPDHRHFKILGNDSSLYTIEFEPASATWELSFFSQQHDFPHSV